MNKFYEPYHIPAQGQPERTVLFQHMKPKHKAGKKSKCFFQLQLLPEKIKKTHTN